MAVSIVESEEGEGQFEDYEEAFTTVYGDKHQVTVTKDTLFPANCGPRGCNKGDLTTGSMITVMESAILGKLSDIDPVDIMLHEFSHIFTNPVECTDPDTCDPIVTNEEQFNGFPEYFNIANPGNMGIDDTLILVGWYQFPVGVGSYAYPGHSEITADVIAAWVIGYDHDDLKDFVNTIIKCRIDGTCNPEG